MNLRDRTAVITGAGSGIGRAIAYRFAAEGAHVMAVDRAGERAAETARHVAEQGGVASAITADVSVASDVARMVDEVQRVAGRTDVLVNNAGATSGDGILDLDEHLWDLDLAVDLKSVFLCCRAFLPSMMSLGSSAIVNIASVNGLFAYGEEAYSAAKAGIINLTKNLAVKHGAQGVRVNCICPGTIRTPVFDPELRRDPELFERLARWYPLGRVGEPEDVASCTLFLASDQSSWMTGSVLVLDGGLTAGSVRMTRELMGLGAGS